MVAVTGLRTADDTVVADAARAEGRQWSPRAKRKLPVGAGQAASFAELVGPLVTGPSRAQSRLLLPPDLLGSLLVRTGCPIRLQTA